MKVFYNRGMRENAKPSVHPGVSDVALRCDAFFYSSESEARLGRTSDVAFRYLFPSRYPFIPSRYPLPSRYPIPITLSGVACCYLFSSRYPIIPLPIHPDHPILHSSHPIIPFSIHPIRSSHSPFIPLLIPLPIHPITHPITHSCHYSSSFITHLHSTSNVAFPGSNVAFPGRPFTPGTLHAPSLGAGHDAPGRALCIVCTTTIPGTRYRTRLQLRVPHAMSRGCTLHCTLYNVTRLYIAACEHTCCVHTCCGVSSASAVMYILHISIELDYEFTIYDSNSR